MSKLGRPKGKKMDDKDNIFVGLLMPKKLAEALTKAAAKDFRNRTQQILWILTDYIDSKEINESDNQPLYTEEELSDMYKQYKESE